MTIIREGNIYFYFQIENTAVDDDIALSAANGVKIALTWQKLKNSAAYKTDTGISGRRQTIQLIVKRNKEEKKRKVYYLEDAFLQSRQRFLKEERFRYLVMIPLTERRQTVKMLRHIFGHENSESLA